MPTPTAAGDLTTATRHRHANHFAATAPVMAAPEKAALTTTPVTRQHAQAVRLATSQHWLISSRKEYILLEPQQNVLIAGTHTRIYRVRPAPRDNELQPSALTAFRDDLSRYHKLNDNRQQDDSKLCTFHIKSFSVEAKITLRNNAALKVAVAKTDSFDMYKIAKDTFSCSTSFGVASHQFKQLFQIKQTGTFTQYKDTMLQHNNTYSIQPTVERSTSMISSSLPFSMMSQLLHLTTLSTRSIPKPSQV